MSPSAAPVPSAPSPPAPPTGATQAPTSIDGCMEQVSAMHIRWPAERFYWAAVDAKSFGTRSFTRRKLRDRLGYILESFVPGFAIEDLEIAYSRGAPDGPKDTYVVCALPKSMIRTAAMDFLTLGPAATPEFVPGQVNISRINFLTGKFAPRSVQRMSKRVKIAVAASLVLCVLIVLAGLERRNDQLNADREVAMEQVSQLHALVLGPTASGENQNRHVRLLGELRRLEQTRSTMPASASIEQDNTAFALEQLLMHWPNDLLVRTDSISVTPAAITITGRVNSMNEVQQLANALSAMGGWQLQQPQSSARRDQVDLTIRLTRVPTLKHPPSS